MKLRLHYYYCIFTGSLYGALGGSARSLLPELQPRQPLLRTEQGAPAAEYLVPTIELSELRNLKASAKANLQAILQDTGLVSISVKNSPAVQTIRAIRETALSAVCTCLADSTARTVSGGLLADGTRRTTLATATIGSTPVPLDIGGSSSSTGSSCLKEDEVSSLEALRDVVFGISQEFTVALDGLHDHSQSLLKTSNGRSFYTIQDITKASHNLEHFHLYEKKESADDCTDDDDTSVLPIHTDAGLFLVFVPGMDCDLGENASSDFFVETTNGIVQRAIFEPDTFGVLFGAGAEHWLLNDNPLNVKATRHAVRMRCGARRAWYGMMHLIPQDAILQDLPQRTFADLRQSFAHSKDRIYTDNVNGDDEDFASIGCGPGSSSVISRVERRHRLAMVEDPSACNNVTNFFCWMSCLPVPDPPESAVASSASLYCLDPRTLDTTQGNVSAAVAVCTGVNGQPGATHNDICVGQWQTSVDGLPEAVKVKENLLLNSSENSYATQFCYGGTSMYMDGFHWLGNTCVIYLFPEWIVSTSGALVGACFGTIFFGMALEGIIRLRRFTVESIPVGTWKRLFCSAIFYGLQLTMGYMIMLIVMTYSGPLFLSVILGLMGGHVVFNADQVYATDPKAPSSKEASTASYGSTEERKVDEQELSFFSPDTDGAVPTASKDLRVPEGCTPCCQNTL